MDEDNGNGKLRAPMMEGAEEPPCVDFRNDVDNAFMGEFGVRNIVKGEDCTRNELSNEKKKDNTAGKIPAFVFV